MIETDKYFIILSVFFLLLHVKFRKEGVQYFVAGAGALTDKVGSKTSEGTLVWAGAGYSAFAAVAATEETFTVNFVNIYGTRSRFRVSSTMTVIIMTHFALSLC